jgi:hypothetical protein
LRGFDLSNHGTACAGGAAKVADAEPRALQRLTAFAVHLADDDGGKRRVFKGQHLALATGDEAFLRGRLLDGVAVRRFQFRYFVPAVLDLRKNDFSACVRKVSAEVVELTGVGMVAAIPDLELGALDGITGDAVYLADLQTGLEGVEEGDGRGFAGHQRNFLRNGIEDNMGRNIFLRHFECANRNRVEENAPMVIGGGAGGKAAVDLLDAEGHALDGFSVGDVLLDDLKTRLFVVHKGDLAGLAGAQRHGLLGIGYDVRLRHGFLSHHINISGDRGERGGAVHASRDGGGIIAGDGLNGKHRTGNRVAAHGVPLGDLHIGQLVVFGGHGVLLVPVRGVHIDADGRGIGAVACGCFGFHEGPQALGDVLDLNDAAVLGHAAADDLSIPIDVEYSAIQTLGRSCGNFLQGNVRIASRRTIRLSWLCGSSDQFSWCVISEEALAAFNAGFCENRQFCGIILNDRSNRSLGGVFLDLLLELRVLLGFFL